MCETINPSVPVSGMGEIRFPSDGNVGSGDTISQPKRKPYKQKPAHTVMGFGKFLKTKRKRNMKIKKINEMSNDDRYYYFSESDLNREVYVPEVFDDDFKKQFDDLDNAKLFSAIKSLYDLVQGDEKPDTNDRDDLLKWIWEYAVCALED